MSSINETLYATLTINYKTSFNEIGCDYGGLTGKSAEDFGKGKPFITYLNVYQNQIITGYNFDYVEIRDRENQNKVRKGDLLFTLSSETPEEAGYSAVYMGIAFVLEYISQNPRWYILLIWDTSLQHRIFAEK